mgnify:CR=1 FL=1
MTNNELSWDKLLQIRTVGRDDTNSDEYRYPYEPTPYCVLERLVDYGLVGGEDVVLDYGCGKGRVEFFLSHRTGAKTIGIEYDARIYDQALENAKTAVSGEKPPNIQTPPKSFLYHTPFSLKNLSLSQYQVS